MEPYYSELNLYDKKARYYYIILLSRRMIFAITMIFLYGQISMQISMFILFTLVKVGYMLDSKPFDKPSLNKIELLNETKTYLVGIFLAILEFYFSANGIASDYDHFVSLGYVIYSTELIVILLNILIVIYFMVKTALKWCLRYKSKIHNFKKRFTKTSNN